MTINSTDIIISWMKRGYTITIIYMRVLFLRIVNVLLRVFGYTRVYDVQNEKDITFFYYLLRSIHGLKLPVSVDFSYPILGVCTYNNDCYIKYICYNEKLSKVEKIKKSIMSSNNYDSIKKIELLNYNGTDNIKIDVTEAKYNFYDIEHFTDPYDMISFYRLYTGDLILNPNVKGNISTVLFTREDFDDSLLETVITYEEICHHS
jgi:hypothetical protein